MSAAPAVPAEPSAGRLLLVDDEPSIRDTVSRYLRFVGYEVRTAGTGREALIEARGFLPELILLDVMLPDANGYELLGRLRADGMHTAVVFLTARDARSDVIKGLAAGGDDYITKPFGMDEVAARVSAVLRRTRRPAGDAAVLRVADLELDTVSYQVSRGGHPIELSPTEFRLLRYLMLNQGRVVTREQLLEHVWSYDFGGNDTVVPTYISYLRRKIDALGPPLIRTRRGVGYRLCAGDESGPPNAGGDGAQTQAGQAELTPAAWAEPAPVAEPTPPIKPAQPTQPSRTARAKSVGGRLRRSAEPSQADTAGTGPPQTGHTATNQAESSSTDTDPADSPPPRGRVGRNGRGRSGRSRTDRGRGESSGPS